MNNPFRKIEKLPTWIFYLPALIIKFAKTFLMRTKIVDLHGNMYLEKLPFITVTWHNRLLFYPAMFPKEYRKRTYALISPSRDGQYIVDLISHFKVGNVRGSSFRKGAAALKKSREVLNRGFNLSVTPDGPRGPKYRMSKGPIILGSLTGVPVIPVSVNYSKYWEVNSWDKFQIPKPGAKINLVVGEPMNIPPNLNDEEIEKWRRIAEDKLNAISFRETE